MPRSDRPRCPDVQDLVSDFHFNILHQVFVDGNRSGRHAAAPINPERAACLDIDKWFHFSLLRDQMPIAPNAADVAPGECEKKAHRKQFRLHRIVFSSWTPISSLLDSKILRRPRPWLRRGYRQINRVDKFIVDIKLYAIFSRCPAIGRAGKSELAEGVADGSNGGCFVDFEIER